MGILDWLTKPILPLSTAFAWNEPFGYKLRLRGDLLWRLGIIFGAWGLASGLLLVVFMLSKNPPASMGIALGLGAVLGLGPAALMLMARRKHQSGRVRVMKDALKYKVSYAGIGGQTLAWAEWPWGTINRCVIVPYHALNKSFSVLLVSWNGQWEMFGIPRSIDLVQLSRFLSAKGVVVKSGPSVPSEFTDGLSPAFGIVSAVVGAAFLVAGMIGFTAHRDAPQQQRSIAAEQFRKRIPTRQFGVRRPHLDRFSTQRSRNRSSDMGHTDKAKPAPPPLPKFPAPASSTSARSATTPAPPSAVSRPSSRTPMHRPAVPGLGGPTRIGPGGPGMVPGKFGGPRGSPFGSQPGARSRPTGPRRPNFPSPPGMRRPATNQPHTELAGGNGGAPFSIAHPGQHVLGFRYALRRWSGQHRIGRLEPLYSADQDGMTKNTVMARQGYAVGAIQVDAGDLVNALAVVFMRIKSDGNLDPSDTYTSAWIGTRQGTTHHVLTGAGAKVVGIHGRRAAVFDAVGLVYEK